MTWRRAKQILLAAIGDDGLTPLWQRLSPDGRLVLQVAFREAREFGQPCIADEHLLLGVLGHGTSAAAHVLSEHGIDVVTARAELMAAGSAPAACNDPATALRSIGIDIEQVRRHLEATFGEPALRAAERRVRRRRWWRGGHRRPRPLCVYLLARRALHFAVELADDRRDARIEPHHLLYGALRDAGDPLGTELSHRARSALRSHGLMPGGSNPLDLLLRRCGVDRSRLAADLVATPS